MTLALIIYSAAAVLFLILFNLIGGDSPRWQKLALAAVWPVLLPIFSWWWISEQL